MGLPAPVLGSDGGPGVGLVSGGRGFVLLRFHLGAMSRLFSGPCFCPLLVVWLFAGVSFLVSLSLFVAGVSRLLLRLGLQSISLIGPGS